MELWFEPEYDWRARVIRHVPGSEFEIQMVQADPEWMGTRIGFRLERRPKGTHVRFHHTGWPSPNEHWRAFCYCWAMYLRLLKRYLEHGEIPPYEKRLEA